MTKNKAYSHRLLAGLMAVAMVFSLVTTALAVNAAFPDVSGHWAENTINELSADGIICGYNDGKCYPDRTITRGEFAALVARYFNFTADRGDTSGFSDVSGHWAAQYICGLSDKGIIRSNAFVYEPDRAITRMEMIKMMVYVLEKEDDIAAKCGTTGFSDDASILESDSGYINIAAEHDIVSGYPNGTVAPYQTATRAEGFEMLKRLIAAYKPVQEEPEKKPPIISGGSYYPPTPKYNITVPANGHIGSEIPVDVESTYPEGTIITWELTKDGVSIDFGGTLDADGGTLTLDEIGDYTLTATITDKNGDEKIVENKITITNNAPVPTISVAVDYADGINTYSSDCKVKATISVDAIDPDGDTFAIEYDAESATTDYYGLGTYTVKARAVDKWGTASDWVEQTFTVACVQPSISMTCEDLGDGYVTPLNDIEFDAEVVTTTPYKITAMDYYYPEGAGSTVDIPALAHTIVKSDEYHEGRHFIIVQVMDWFGNTAYTSRFFIMGETETEVKSEITGLTTTVYENGVFDGETPLAYIESFTFHIPAIQGHNSQCRDTVAIYGLTEDGTTEKLIEFNTNNGYALVNSDGTYEYNKTKTETITDTWEGWDSHKYVQLAFSYNLTHESCLEKATEGMTYSVQYGFIFREETDWEDMFQ